MFQFTRPADDGTLAIALDHLRIAAQRRDEFLGHLETQRLQSSMKGWISS